MIQLSKLGTFNVPILRPSHQREVTETTRKIVTSGNSERGNLSPASGSGKPTTELGEFATRLGDSGVLLGLDIGEKTIGLAISDGTRLIASPVDTIRRKKWSDDLKQLLDLIAQRHVVGLVAGLPINMDGSEGPRCQSVRQFAANLLVQIDIPIAFWDERLSTVAVTRTLLDADLSRKRRGEVVDKLAAAYILQGALDNLTQGGGG